MGRPSLILAALAADAAPGKNFRHYLKVDGNPDVEILRLWDAEGVSFELKIPATGNGVSELATELSVLRALKPVAANLPFEVPNQVGQTQDSDGTKAVVFTLLGGSSPDLSRLAPGVFSKSFAQSMAALHSLDTSTFVDAGLPTYDSTALLHQKVQELDQMAATGRIPAPLLSRWESALEDIGLFRFHPTVVHGSISSETVMIEGQQVVGIVGWNSLSVADPAEDFRWLSGGALPSTFEDALIHYRALRPNADENLAQRANLYSELELGSWLLHCLEVGDVEQIKQAEDLLTELKDNLEAGNLKDLTATSFVGLAAASTIIPMAMDTSPITEVVAEEEIAAESEDFSDDSGSESMDELTVEVEVISETDAMPTETSLDELF